MDTVKAAVNTFDTSASNALKTIDQSSIVHAIVVLFLMLYAARIAPVPPQPVLNLFGNFYFRLFIFAIILWTAQLSPSMSILIALCFLVTINYANTGKLFETLDNTKPVEHKRAEQQVSSAAAPIVTPQASATAVNTLAQAAATPVAADQTAVKAVADVAVANMTTPQGAAAVQTLAQQAVSPSAAPLPAVQAAAQTAIQAIAQPVVVTPEQSSSAVQVLAQAAASPAPAPTSAIATVAQIAAANVVSPQGSAAVQALAQQAAAPAAGNPEQVVLAASTAMKSLGKEYSGCYPTRNFDMSKVEANIEGKITFEDLAPFSA